MPRTMLPPFVEALFPQIGYHLRTWRLAQRLSASIVAQRAGISRTTLRTIETDPSSVSFHSVMAVASVLGVGDEVVKAFNPLSSDRGQVLLYRAANNQG